MRVSQGIYGMTVRKRGRKYADENRDAGIVLSSYLYGLKNGFEKTQPKELSALKRILTKPKTRILELGAGCGIVGITLATCFEGAEVIMTDLPEAEEIAKFNISKNVGKPPVRAPNIPSQRVHH